jgi:hypothetical protein
MCFTCVISIWASMEGSYFYDEHYNAQEALLTIMKWKSLIGLARLL